MTKEEAFRAWAPDESLWSAWAKPVLFAHLDRVLSEPNQVVAEVLPPAPPFAPPATGVYAVVVDLSGSEGLVVGMGLAWAGFRPVPLYNSVPTPTPTFPSFSAGKARVAVDVSMLLAGLAHFAPALAKASLPPKAPPAFLLDSRRRVGDGGNKLQPGDFDNRSVSLPTDFPSATRLLAEGIGQVVVVSYQREMERDLAHTLRRWQDGGIKLLRCGPKSTSHVPFKVPKPERYKLLWHALLARIGLRASPLGGFGGYIPEPSSSGGGIG